MHAPPSDAQENLTQLGVAPGDVVQVQNIIALVNAELRDGESEESAAKRVLEMASSKPAAASTLDETGAAEEKVDAPPTPLDSSDAKTDDPPAA